MKFLLDEHEVQQTEPETVYPLSALQRAYGCRCQRAIFFRNSHCLSCDTPLGYEPHLGQVLSLAPGPVPETWHLAGPHAPYGDAALYRRCANLNTAAACNWLVKMDADAERMQPLCISCRLNRTIPDQSIPENVALWGRIEHAKRSVIAALIAMGLPVASRVSEDPERGLAFNFLQSLPGSARVLTGHDNGLITLNIEEAEDATRERIRSSMREPYRTLVGHFRHEVGHYYWDRLVAGSRWLSGFRALFGDERADYAAALQTNYREGPSPDWAAHYISAYASVHPWEDWAETWAHYMHMVDTLGTAKSFGLSPENISMPFDCFGPEALYESERDGSRYFLSLVNGWLKLSAVMNELCRSMGQADFYPFVLPRAAVTKLHFVHLVVCDGCHPQPL